jgi:hypothetical protein
MSITTYIIQKDVNDKSKEIFDKITDYYEFVNTNYRILLKKSLNTPLERLIISQSKDNYMFNSPELIRYYCEIVAFYLAMEELKVPYELW